VQTGPARKDLQHQQVERTLQGIGFWHTLTSEYIDVWVWGWLGKKVSRELAEVGARSRSDKITGGGISPGTKKRFGLPDRSFLVFAYAALVCLFHYSHPSMDLRLFQFLLVPIHGIHHRDRKSH
jgi:hypothetical protein